jgi:hypothetical protein
VGAVSFGAVASQAPLVGPCVVARVARLSEPCQVHPSGRLRRVFDWTGQNLPGVLAGTHFGRA